MYTKNQCVYYNFQLYVEYGAGYRIWLFVYGVHTGPITKIPFHVTTSEMKQCTNKSRNVFDMPKLEWISNNKEM